jgi:hypothetical protein
MANFAPGDRVRGLWNRLCAGLVTASPHADKRHHMNTARAALAHVAPSANRSGCREIQATDSDAIIDLLTSGFDRKREYWSRAWRLLADRDCPEGLPRFGYLLEWNGKPVGVLLLIYSSEWTSGGKRIRCNVSSWYVAPAFRSYATILSRRATKIRRVCYFNVTPALHTWPMLEAEGYVQFTKGRIVVVPLLTRRRVHADVSIIQRGVVAGDDLSRHDIALLLDHAEFGCLSLICEANGERHPFVFRSRYRRFGIRVMQLVYCRDIADFVRFAAPLGRFLARHDYFVVILNSNGPITGLVGYYRGGTPKYCKGEPAMRTGDLAYSEVAMFGY